MSILIGSAAIKYHFPDFKREPKDYDYISEVADKGILGDKKVEYLENPILWELYSDYEVLPINVLYNLKLSHIAWDINWEKHLYDIIFLQQKGCFLNKELFYSLYEYWNTYHNKNKRYDLKMSADKFFDNAIKCPYSHDYLHTLIVDAPTYSKILKDGEEVEVSEEKFNNLSFEEKLSLVREEVYVMAYERLAGRHYRTAYTWMLKKFIISHAPIWEMLFIIQNYEYLYKPHINYVELINNKLKNNE